MHITTDKLLLADNLLGCVTKYCDIKYQFFVCEGPSKINSSMGIVGLLDTYTNSVIINDPWYCRRAWRNRHDHPCIARSKCVHFVLPVNKKDENVLWQDSSPNTSPASLPVPDPTVNGSGMSVP